MFVLHIYITEGHLFFSWIFVQSSMFTSKQGNVY